MCTNESAQQKLQRIVQAQKYKEIGGVKKNTLGTMVHMDRLRDFLNSKWLDIEETVTGS